MLFILTLQNRVDRGLENLAVLAALRDHQGGDPQELDSDTRHAGVFAADHAIDLGNRGLLNKIGDLVIGRILRESFLKFGDGGIDVAFLELGETLLQQAILILGDRAGERSKQQCGDEQASYSHRNLRPPRVQLLTRHSRENLSSSANERLKIPAGASCEFSYQNHHLSIIDIPIQ